MERLYEKLWIIELILVIIFLLIGLIMDRPTENIIALLLFSLLSGMVYLFGLTKNQGGAMVLSIGVLITGIIIMFANR